MKQDHTLNHAVKTLEKLIPIQEVSAQTGVNVRIITRAIKTKMKYKKLVASKIGKSWMVSKADWEDYVYRRSNISKK